MKCIFVDTGRKDRKGGGEQDWETVENNVTKFILIFFLCIQSIAAPKRVQQVLLHRMKHLIKMKQHALTAQHHARIEIKLWRLQY